MSLIICSTQVSQACPDGLVWYKLLLSEPQAKSVGGKPRSTYHVRFFFGRGTLKQGVALLTGSYSMAVRPIEEHQCVLRGKGTQIKYATKMLRALFHAKPNISHISANDKVKVWCNML